MRDIETKSLVSDFMDEKNWLKKEIETLTSFLTLRDSEISVLIATLADRK